MITFQLKTQESNQTQKDSTDGFQDVEKTTRVKIEIFDDKNNLIRTLNVNAKDGINRTFWRLDRKGVQIPRWEETRQAEDFEPSGPEVLPGRYMVKISYKDFTDSTLLMSFQIQELKFQLKI